MKVKINSRRSKRINKKGSSFYKTIVALSKKTEDICTHTYSSPLLQYWESLKVLIKQAAQQGHYSVIIKEMPCVEGYYKIDTNTGDRYFAGFRLNDDLARLIEAEGFEAEFGGDFWEDGPWGVISWS